MEQDDFNKLDSEIIDVDELDNTEIKINPDYYIHKAIIKAQDALAKDNMKEGFNLYRIFIEHIELMARSSKNLPPKYEEDIKSFEATKDYTEEKDALIKSIKLANKKLELIMTEIFSKKMVTDPLKL